MDYYLCPTQREDVLYLADHLRQQDRVEIQALYGQDADYRGLILSTLEHAAWANTVFYEGVPAIIYGVSPADTLQDAGCPWLVATDAFYQLTRAFLKENRGTFQQMHEEYPFLFNYVHQDNHASKKWLTWCGFTVEPPGTAGAPPDFQFFYSRRSA